MTAARRASGCFGDGRWRRSSRRRAGRCSRCDSAARAATYKWVDDQGVVHYTDKMPPEARQQGQDDAQQAGSPGEEDRARAHARAAQGQEDETSRGALARRPRTDMARKDRALLSSYTTEERDRPRQEPRARGPSTRRSQSAEAYTARPEAQQAALAKKKAGFGDQADARASSSASSNNIDVELSRQASTASQQKQKELVTVNARVRCRQAALAQDAVKAARRRNCAAGRAPPRHDREAAVEEVVAPARVGAAAGRPSFARDGAATIERPACDNRAFASAASHPDGAVRLHDEPGGQDRAPQARDPQGHLALLLPRAPRSACWD